MLFHLNPLERIYKMIIKKSAVIVFLTLFFVFAANAMPPHPNNTNPTGREKTESPNTAQEPLYKSMLRSSPARVHPFSSPMNLLVILAEFGAELPAQAAVAPLNGNNILKKSGYIIPALLLIFLIIQILFKNRKRFVLLNACILLLLSCPDEGGNTDTDPGDPLYFKTDIGVFKNILGANGADVPNPVQLTMKKYWQDMSQNNFNLNIDVVGPVRVSKGWQYYGRNNKSGDDSHPGQLVSEAVKLAHPEVLSLDPTNGYAKYDNNGDSYVDTVIVVFAGQGEEQKGTADAIWSHSFSLAGTGSGIVLLDGVRINRYTVQPEYNIKPGDATIGVFCHEFAHVLGLPDLYDTIKNSTHGVGHWSLMSAGSWGSSIGKDPAPLLAWERYELGGDAWVTIKPCTKTTQTINILDIELSKTAYMIPLNTDNATTATQYLLLERKTKAFDPVDPESGKIFVPATGILITHINEAIVDKYWRHPTETKDYNRVNSYKDRPHGVNIVESNGTDSGGTGVLWNAAKTLDKIADYEKMIFSHSDNTKNKINLSTPGIDDNFPNSNYYLEETLTSKTGYSGIAIKVTEENSVDITVTTP